MPADAFGRLDHVFLIIMENQSNTDMRVLINAYAKIANQATNYFAVGHPSAPNYLEMTGGSNFGVPNDYWPNWVNTGCVGNNPGSTSCDNALRQSPHRDSIIPSFQPQPPRRISTARSP